MANWKPATQGEVEAMISDELARCSDAHQELFERLRMPMTSVAIERFGRHERVFAVARIGRAFVFYDDVEDGFEIAEPDPDGVVRFFGANQFDLAHILHRVSTGAET